ncbi:preferentially expressed antigen in melanoma-like protein 1 [Acomys russatus]|uniref:preferentially expressed antigen in melanoma-like protein 1 n=1 Tax=Acomys russatus TaxID=60746 RepID=UPI0021E2ADB1|nr:preferentially expressed antigen in melanoma-like protein 1 [Acomys russatus]
MSLPSPPALQELAENSLLKEQALAISALDEIPSLFFPSLFRKACRRGCVGLVKAMMKAWPFPCLPLGAMIRRKAPYRRTLEIVLHGLDALLFQKVPHRRCKLKMLDLRVMPLKLWKTLPVFRAEGWSERQEAVGPSGAEVEQPVKVVIDLVLRERLLEPFESFLVQWVEQRKGLVRLCCGQLQIWSMSLYYHRKVLELLALDSTQELCVYCISNPVCLLNFSPYLGRMRNLRSLVLSHFWQAFSMTPVWKQQVITQFTSQFLKLERLQNLCLDTVVFLEGHLDELFWWLKTPLETLSVIDCNLSKSDWNHICEFPCTSQLKHLNLKCVKLTRLSPEPLRVLLLKCASTLMTLDLESCQMTDSQLSAILPALRCCTRLTQFNLHGNRISLPVLKELAVNIISLTSQQARTCFISSCDHRSGLDLEVISQPYVEFV